MLKVVNCIHTLAQIAAKAGVHPKMQKLYQLEEEEQKEEIPAEGKQKYST